MTAIVWQASAQAPSAELAFEAATIKPIDPSYRFNAAHHWVHVYPAHASFWYMSLDSLFGYAYGLEPFQVEGKDWTGTERFDIEARFPEGADQKDNQKMLQTLLKDRFQLTFHVERKELEGYVLVAGKHVERLRPSAPDVASPALKPGEKSAPAPSRVTTNPDGSSTIDLGRRGTQTIRYDQENAAIRHELSKMTMEELTKMLGICLGSGAHRVVDETGLKGNYQVTYDCPTSRAATSASAEGSSPMLPSDPQASSALTRSLDAMGLKLERRRILTEVYVIDQVQQPSEN